MRTLLMIDFPDETTARDLNTIARLVGASWPTAHVYTVEGENDINHALESASVGPYATKADA